MSSADFSAGPAWTNVRIPFSELKREGPAAAWNRTDLAGTRRGPELGEPDLVYVHCLGGARASVSAVFLARLGIHAVHVDGHFSSWRPQMHEVAQSR